MPLNKLKIALSKIPREMLEMQSFIEQQLYVFPHLAACLRRVCDDAN